MTSIDKIVPAQPTTTAPVQIAPPSIEFARRDTAITRALAGLHADTVDCYRGLGGSMGFCGSLGCAIGSIGFGTSNLAGALAMGIPFGVSIIGWVMMGQCDPSGSIGYDEDRHQVRSVTTTGGGAEG